MAKMEFLADDYDAKVTSLTADVQTTEFDWQGDRYTLDLGPDNRDKLQAAREEYEAAVARAAKKFADKWMDKAVPVEDYTPPAVVKPPTRAKSNKTDGKTSEYLGQVRQWARKNGAEIPDRGRVNKDVVEAYRTQNPKLIPVQYRKTESGAQAPQAPADTLPAFTEPTAPAEKATEKAQKAPSRPARALTSVSGDPES